MINPEHKLSIRRQSELLEISRSTVYYRPRPMSDADLMLMRRIDELHMNYPFAGSRMLRDLEGTAEVTSDPTELGRVAGTYESKYGAHFASPAGTWSGLGDATRPAQIAQLRVLAVGPMRQRRY